VAEQVQVPERAVAPRSRPERRTQLQREQAIPMGWLPLAPPLGPQLRLLPCLPPVRQAPELRPPAVVPCSQVPATSTQPTCRRRLSQGTRHSQSGKRIAGYSVSRAHYRPSTLELYQKIRCSPAGFFRRIVR
jgi:hypothetical protein